MRTRSPRAVVRWRGMSSGSRSKGRRVTRNPTAPWLRALGLESSPDEDRRLREAGPRGQQAPRPRNQAARPLGGGSAQRLRRPRGRGGASRQGSLGRGRGRRSSRWARRRRPTRSARRSRWAPTARCSSPTTARPAPTWSRRAVCSPRRSSASSPTSCSSGSRPPTPTARSCGRRSPSACAGRSSPRWPSSTVEDGKARGKRQTEFGYDVIEAPLPAVVAVSDAINEPRYPSLKGIMGAKSKPQETVSLADLGVEAGAKTRRSVALSDPPPRGETKQDRGRRERGRADRRVPRGDGG